MSTKIMTGGYEIAAFEKTSHDLAHLRIHRMGSPEMAFLTPAEAEVLGDAIVKGAAIARGLPDGAGVWALRELPKPVIDLLKKIRTARTHIDLSKATPTNGVDVVLSQIEAWIDDVVKFDAETPR